MCPVSSSNSPMDIVSPDCRDTASATGDLMVVEEATESQGSNSIEKYLV